MKHRPLVLFAVALAAVDLLGGCAATAQDSDDSAATAARAEARGVAFPRVSAG